MFMMGSRVTITLACLLATGVVAAQPAPPVDKTDAKALMQSGLKLFAAKDYLGALAVFREAYTRLPSAKILLNIGTTLTRLDRKAEAANAYQQYLDAEDADPKKQPEVEKALAELDRAVGMIELATTPTTAEVQIGDGEWLAAESAKRYRVAAGEVTVRARADHFQPATRTVRTIEGGKLALSIELTAVATPTLVGTETTGSGIAGGIVGATAPRQVRSRFGVVALAHVDVVHPGGAALVGVTADLSRRFQIQATALVGKTAGGYASASFALLDGRVRPLLVAGVPIFVSHGARFSVRGAGGLELELNRHLALIAEVGVEYVFNPEPNVARTLFVPAIGAAGRL